MSYIDINKYSKKSEILKAIANPTRLCIVSNLAKDGEKCINEMQDCLQISQPLVSQHIKVLRDIGIITVRKDKNNRYYKIADKNLVKIISILTKMEETL